MERRAQPAVAALSEWQAWGGGSRQGRARQGRAGQGGAGGGAAEGEWLLT